MQIMQDFQRLYLKKKIIFKELTRLCWMIFQIYKFNLEILLFAMQYKE